MQKPKVIKDTIVSIHFIGGTQFMIVAHEESKSVLRAAPLICESERELMRGQDRRQYFQFGFYPDMIYIGRTVDGRFYQVVQDTHNKSVTITRID